MNDCGDCKYWNDALVMCTHPFGEKCVDGFSFWWPKQSVTNVDRIRNMAVVDLAKYLWEVERNLNTPRFINEWIDWLQQEVKE